MVSFDIQPATTPADYRAVGDLIRQYAVIRGFDAAMGDIESEMATLPGIYAPPEGALILARADKGAALGCAAYKALSPLRCEMKRMFVAPAWQGLGIGRALALFLIDTARKARYHEMVLDTHPQMQAAHSLYHSLGFVPVPRYNQNPTPGIRFMGLTLHFPAQSPQDG